MIRLSTLVRNLLIAIAAGGIAYIVFLGVLNSVGPSTRYYNPNIGTAVQRDGKSYVYVGDEFFVWITIVRHKLNGSCTFAVRRYAEVVGGPRNGRRYMISTAVLYFRGEDEIRRTRWPIPDDPYFIGLAYEEFGPNEPFSISWPEEEIEKRRRLSLTIPLLPEGVDEREFTFFVVGRYFCNELDYLIPRYIQGGDRPNITPRVNAVLSRHKP